jgi:hypothetical protein
MSEFTSEQVGGCPPWCRTVGGADDGGPHAHVSQDLLVGDSLEGTTARMIQLAGSDQVRVVVGDSVVSVEEAESFAHALLRLTADAQLAQPGLGFVEQLLQQRGMSTGELALAAGLDLERVRAQRSGAAVLTVREFDRVALAAAQLHCLVVEDLDEVDLPVPEPVDQAVVLETAVDQPVAVEPVAEEPVVEEPVVEQAHDDVEEPVAPAVVEDAFDGATWADLMELMALAGGSMPHDDEPADETVSEAVSEAVSEPVAEPVAETADERQPVDEAPVEHEPTVRSALEPVAEPASEAVPESRRQEVVETWAFDKVELVELIRLGGGTQQPAV